MGWTQFRHCLLPSDDGVLYYYFFVIEKNKTIQKKKMKRAKEEGNVKMKHWVTPNFDLVALDSRTFYSVSIQACSAFYDLVRARYRIEVPACSLILKNVLLYPYLGNLYYLLYEMMECFWVEQLGDSKALRIICIYKY